MQYRTKATSEERQPRDEDRISRLVWVSRLVAFALTVGVAAFFVVIGADDTWQYIVYPLLAAIPVLFGILSARYVHLMHVDQLRGHHAQLMLRTIELEKMAARDELTQLFNRRHFYECFQEGLARVQVSKQTLALIVLDIDGLKKINDEYGHAVGDIIIANLAKVIDKHTRVSDVPARLGGDEFAILMPNTDKRGAFSLAERLWAELEEIPMYEHEGIRVMLNVSIGVSGFPWGGENADEIMRWADVDMYANKVSRRLPQAAVSISEEPPDDAGLEDFDRI